MEGLKKISPKKLKKILRKHQKWIESTLQKGERANLSEADLHGANLREANLIEANLHFANLGWAKSPIIACLSVPRTHQAFFIEGRER